jgi:hypothetical protein
MPSEQLGHTYLILVDTKDNADDGSWKDTVWNCITAQQKIICW